jgi:hypothetical protein
VRGIDFAESTPSIVWSASGKLRSIDLSPCLISLKDNGESLFIYWVCFRRYQKGAASTPDRQLEVFLRKRDR